MGREGRPPLSLEPWSPWSPGAPHGGCPGPGQDHGIVKCRRVAAAGRRRNQLHPRLKPAPTSREPEPSRAASGLQFPAAAAGNRAGQSKRRQGDDGFKLPAIAAYRAASPARGAPGRPRHPQREGRRARKGTRRRAVRSFRRGPAESSGGPFGSLWIIPAGRAGQGSTVPPATPPQRGQMSLCGSKACGPRTGRALDCPRHAAPP